MRELDGKYSVDGDTLFNTVSGEPIPDDEPLFFLRARDHNALQGLKEYRAICTADGCVALHLAGIEQAIMRFEAFRRDHPERMKQPGITQHMRLKP